MQDLCGTHHYLGDSDIVHTKVSDILRHNRNCPRRKAEGQHRTDKEIDNATYRKLLRQAQLGTLHFHTSVCVCV